jgi:hypothetical protein
MGTVNHHLNILVYAPNTHGMCAWAAANTHHFRLNSENMETPIFASGCDSLNFSYSSFKLHNTSCFCLCSLTPSLFCTLIEIFHSMTNSAAFIIFIETNHMRLDTITNFLATLFLMSKVWQHIMIFYDISCCPHQVFSTFKFRTNSMK